MVFFKKNFEDNFRKSNEKDSILNLNSKEKSLNEDSKFDTEFDKEFLDVIESDKESKNKEDVSFEIKEFEVVKNSIDELKNELLRLQNIIVEHFNDKKNDKIKSFDNAFPCEEFKIFFSKAISDLHENVYEEKKKFSKLVELYKEQIEILKNQNELLKEINEKLEKT